MWAIYICSSNTVDYADQHQFDWEHQGGDAAPQQLIETVKLICYRAHFLSIYLFRTRSLLG